MTYVFFYSYVRSGANEYAHWLSLCMHVCMAVFSVHAHVCPGAPTNLYTPRTVKVMTLLQQSFHAMQKNLIVTYPHRMTPLDLGVKLFEDKARNLTDLCLPRASESITSPSSVILFPFRLSLRYTHQKFRIQHACSSA